MSFETYSSDNQHCILVENVKTIDEKQIDLYVLFGQLAYVNYCYISQNYYFLVYLDCRDAKKALPCIGKMTMLNGVTGLRVTTRFASIDEIVEKCHDPQLYTRLSATINIKYFQGYSQHNLNHMDIRILHCTFGEVSHSEWLAPDALAITYFSIASKVKALAQLTKDYAAMGIPVAIKDGGDVKLFQPQMLFSPSSPTSFGTSVGSSAYYPASASTASTVSSLIHPMSQLQCTPPVHLKQKHKPNKRQNTKRNDVVVYKMMNGMDTRTTLMLKNIPNRYTQKMMIDFLNETLQGQFDFLYLRMDYENHCNVGYAFVNMTNLQAAAELVERVEGKSWPRFNSHKIGQVTYAEIQGMNALLRKFENSDVMKQDARYQPKLFNPYGPVNGVTIGERYRQRG